MALETFGYIDDLVDTNPVPGDPVGQGDDHLRGIKESVQGNVAGDVLSTRLLVKNLNALVVSRNGAELTIFDLLGEAGSTLATMGFGSSSTLAIVNRLFGAQFALLGTDAGGVQRNMIVMTADSGVAIFDEANVARLVTSSLGAAIVGLLSATGQVTTDAAAPVAANDLTRKDYVDAIGSQVTANTGDIAVNKSDITDNTADILANTTELADISSSTGNQQLKVGNMQVLGGTEAAALTTHNITFDVPFTSTPSVTATTNVTNSVARIATISSTEVQITCSLAAAVRWIAIGSNTA